MYEPVRAGSLSRLFLCQRAIFVGKGTYEEKNEAGGG
jgi:hypothetical protein